MSSQEQRGGVGSTNVQIGSVTTGLSYADVRDIASDLFERNFSHLAAVARDTANARAEQIRDEILAKLESAPEARPESFGQVEKQLYLLEAQKGFALSGDEDLKSLLVNAVVGVSSAAERSKKSIVLGEAIKVAPLLTPEQLRALATSFSIWNVNFGVTSLIELFKRYEAAADLSKFDIELTDGDFRHLEYLSCGTLATHHLAFAELLRSDYPGLLQLGYTPDELSAAFNPDQVPAGIWRTAQRDPSRLELAIRRSSDFANIASFTPHQAETGKRLLSERLIDESTVRAELKTMGGKAEYIYDRWAASKLSDFRLTSVGIAIGYTFVAERLAMPDLDIFL